MHKEVTMLKVEDYETPEGKPIKRWIIKQCDTDKELVGFPTQYGVPYPADKLPVGSRYKTIFTMPE